MSGSHQMAWTSGETDNDRGPPGGGASCIEATYRRSGPTTETKYGPWAAIPRVFGSMARDETGLASDVDQLIEVD